MPYTNRRQFLQSSALMLTAGLTGFGFARKELQPLLAFSTLGCPDWPFDKIVSFAAQNNYEGIEVRGIVKEMDLTKCKEFLPQNIKATLQMMQENKLRFVDLGSSCTLHFPPGEERTKNLDEGKRFIDLAHRLSCPYVRVFPNLFPKERSKEETINLISKGLLELGIFAKGSGVKVLVESHGDLVHIADLKTVMQASEHPNTGMIWDVTNMWTITGEPPADVYHALKKYIHHTHIKDAKKEAGEVKYKLLGEGEVPIFEAIDLLQRGGYTGYYSFEWEKLWHPEIDAPEVALADYRQKMKQHFNQEK